MLLLWANGNDPPEPPGEDPNDCEDRMPQNPAPEPEQLLTPSEVAAMFRVNPKTVTRWARAGKISAGNFTRSRATSCVRSGRSAKSREQKTPSATNRATPSTWTPPLGPRRDVTTLKRAPGGR